MPCGYGLDEARREAQELLHQPALDGSTRIWAAHAKAFNSPPGRLLIDGIEALAGALHPPPLPDTRAPIR